MADLRSLINQATAKQPLKAGFDGLSIGSVDLDGPKQATKPPTKPVQADQAKEATPDRRVATGTQRGPKLDLRKVNTTGRLVQIGTRVHADTDERVRQFCARRKLRLKMVEAFGVCHFIELAIDVLEDLERKEFGDV